MKRYHQNGAAIIMVLLIVALAASLAAYMAEQQSLWQRQVESQLDHAQVRRLGIAGIDWARAVLSEDARGSDIDHDQELWAMQLPALPVEGGEVLGVIKDRQGLYNINNLTRGNTDDMTQFTNLLRTLGLPQELALAVIDFVKPQNETENVYYLGLARPYRASKQKLTEIGELALIKGFDARTIETLRDFVTVLPEPTAINVNFAPPEVLAAVLQEGTLGNLRNMSLATARIVAQRRNEKPFKDVADFRERLPNGASLKADSDVVFKSHYFWVTGRASIGRAHVLTHALLHRSGSGWPKVVWQSVQ